MRPALVLLLLILATTAGGERLPPVSSYAAQELVVLGDSHSTMGIYDPTIQPVPGQPDTFVMSFTSVPELSLTAIELAISADGGGTWELGGKVSAVRPVTIACPKKFSPYTPFRCTGDMVDEVSFVFHDPTDPDPRRVWKVFTHSWFYSNATQTHFQWGYISLYTASTLTQKSVWARESLLGWVTPPSLDGVPMSHEGVSQNLTDIPELEHCAIFSEPSVIVRNDGLYLALGCIALLPDPPYSQNDIVLLKSTDHARSFTFVSTLLSGSDATGLGWTMDSFNGGNLFSLPIRSGPLWSNASAGETSPGETSAVTPGDYLIASPSGKYPRSNNARNYVGCVVFRVADLAKGLLERAPAKDGSATGLPRVYRYMFMKQDPKQCGACFNGACTYAGSSKLGYVSNSFVHLGQPWWQVSKTPFFAP